MEALQSIAVIKQVRILAVAKEVRKSGINGFGNVQQTQREKLLNAKWYLMHSVGHLVGVPAAAVATERTAQGGKEAKEERNECAENEPVGVAPRRVDTAVAHVLARDAEENHLNNPGNERYEERECADESHEDGTRAVICGTAETEENGDARKTSA